MPVTVEQARDEMCNVLKVAWAAGAYSSAPILWDDKSALPPLDTTAVWLRMTIKHAGGGASSLGSPDGLKRFTRIGLIAVQCFVNPGQGNVTLDAVVDIIMHAFERASTANGVWFRNVRFKEIGAVGGWNQANVLVDFEYDTVR